MLDDRPRVENNRPGKYPPDPGCEQCGGTGRYSRETPDVVFVDAACTCTFFGAEFQALIPDVARAARKLAKELEK